MEMQKKYRIALISPSRNAYSETFIQDQKNNLDGTVFYYYGEGLPKYLEGGKMVLTRKERLFYKMKKKFKSTSFSLQELTFIKSLKKNNIQVVLAQYGPTANRILRVCKYLDLPLITHFHGYDASIRTVVKNCNNYKEVFSYSSFVIVVSKKMEQMLLELGCPKEKVIYNSCTPNEIFLEVSPKYTKKQFIGIGRFTDKKAPYYTILAFKEVLLKHPNAHLKIAGIGILLNVCENLIELYNLSKNVELLGVITPEEYRLHLSESLAFVQHSITAKNGDMEGTPVALLEASAAGLPVISTIHAGIPDVIIHGETGFLVEEHDIKGMTEYMLKVLDNKNLAIQLGQKGKERIRKNFTQERQLDVLDGLIEKTIQSTK